MNDRVIISLDQAITTGWCVTIDGDIVSRNHFTVKGNDYDIKINKIKEVVIKLTEKYKPHLITVEGVQYQSNQAIYGKLSRLQGVLINYFIENNILYEIVTPSQWKGYHKIKGRKRAEQKANAMLRIKELGIDCDSEDECEAILMNIYAQECIDIKFK